MDREPVESEPWRERVLRRMLTVGAFIAPPVVALSLFGSASTRTMGDAMVLGSTGIVLPLFRLARGISVRARALMVIAFAFGASVYFLGRIGFAAGITVALFASCVLGVIYLGRSVGFLFIGLTGVSVATVGWLVTTRAIVLQAADVDPTLLRNWVRMAGTSTLLAAFLTSVIDFVIRQVEAGARASTEALIKLRLAYQRLGRLHGKLDAAKERERGSLAHELRDELGQSLTTLKLHLQLKVPDVPGFVDTVALVDQLISQVRRMSGDLRPPLLDEIGLVPALRAYLENQAALFGLVIDLQADVPDGAERLGPDLEIACFRVVQESLTNALRYAGARRIEVRFRRDAARVSLSIADDGRGFDTATLEEAAAAGHLGVVGMRERVLARGGGFRLTSRPDRGTLTEVELPLLRPHDAAEGELRQSVPAERAARLTAIGAWREDVRNGMLTVVAIFTPLLVILGLLIGPPRALKDIIVLAATGALLPLLRLARTPSIAAQAATAILILFGVALYLLSRAGFGTGVSVLLVTACVMAVVCLQRAFGFALIVVTGLAYVGMGLMAAHRQLRFDPAEVDPMSLFIWLRLAALISLLAAMLALVVDFVIRHVETSAGAVTSALEELRLAYRRLGLLHRRLDAAKEEERRFLAHELHDELGQTLTAIKLRLQVATRQIDGGEAAVRETVELIDDLITRVRKISIALRPPLLDEVGLFPALRAYTEGQAASSGVAIDLTTEMTGTGDRLPPDIEIACFRLVQESIANALRHAGAKRLSIRTVQRTDQLSLSIRDDGAGFDVTGLDDDHTQERLGEQLGVLGMRERVRALAGQFHLTSRPGAGTAIEISLPLVEAR